MNDDNQPIQEPPTSEDAGNGGHQIDPAPPTDSSSAAEDISDVDTDKYTGYHDRDNVPPRPPLIPPIERRDGEGS